MSDRAVEYSDRSTGGVMAALSPAVDSFLSERGMAAVTQSLNHPSKGGGGRGREGGGGGRNRKIESACAW